MKAIINGKILTPQGELEHKVLLFDEKISDIVDSSASLEGMEVIDAQGKYVSPGLVDVHIHGYVGEDASDGSEEGVRKIAKALLANGVTSFLPTTMTVSWEEIETALNIVRKLKTESAQTQFDGSQILGCHAEGPFINPSRKGAQAEEHILPPNSKAILPHQDIIKIITMSPEMESGIQFIKDVTSNSNIVVSIGHTNATYEQAMEAIEAGAKHVTHLFNAMTALNHRNPGVVGAALSTDVSTELIADTFHIHTGLFAFLHGVKNEKLILITDCTRAGGLPDGEYTLGGQPIFVKGIECRLEDGTIAGSVLRLNNAVKNYRDHAGIPLWKAVQAASLNPATVIGEADTKGSLEVGKDADIVLFDENLVCHKTFVRGELKYNIGE